MRSIVYERSKGSKGSGFRARARIKLKANLIRAEHSNMAYYFVIKCILN